MRGGIVFGAGALCAAAGLAIGLQLCLALHTLGGTAHTPWGPLPVALLSSLALGLAAGAFSLFFAVTAARRMQAFMAGRGVLRLARDLPPVVGVGLAAGLVAGNWLGPASAGDVPIWLEPAAAADLRGEYDDRLNELEENLLLAMRPQDRGAPNPAGPPGTGDAPTAPNPPTPSPDGDAPTDPAAPTPTGDAPPDQGEPTPDPDAPTPDPDAPGPDLSAPTPGPTAAGPDGEACKGEAARVLTARMAWVATNLQDYEIKCARPGRRALGFDDSTLGAVILDETRVCNPVTPFSLEVLSDTYVKCHINPSGRSRRALEALRGAVAFGRIDSIEFVGHTDDAPIKPTGCRAEDRTRIVDNWQLSALRADRARAAFLGSGPDLPPLGGPNWSTHSDITARAVGVQDEAPLPLAPGEDKETWRARNRRVTVSITGSSELNFNTQLCLEAKTSPEP